MNGRVAPESAAVEIAVDGSDVELLVLVDLRLDVVDLPAEFAAFSSLDRDADEAVMEMDAVERKGILRRRGRRCDDQRGRGGEGRRGHDGFRRRRGLLQDPREVPGPVAVAADEDLGVE